MAGAEPVAAVRQLDAPAGPTAHKGHLDHAKPHPQAESPPDSRARLLEHDVTILAALLDGLAALLITAASAITTVPPWQLQAGESCDSYLSRIEAQDYELWRQHWCGDGPCYRVLVLPTGQAVKTAEGFTMDAYWTEKRHGCEW